MSTITTIAAGDQISSSRTDINTNFSNLNSDKIETSVIDTDTTLAANSDSKIPSQKAIKAYVDALTAEGFEVQSGGTTSDNVTWTLSSVTSTATQRLIVFAKGVMTGTALERTVTLSYNGVAKDTCTLELADASDNGAFMLMYTEVPGAGTQDITVDVTAGAGTIAQVFILVLKIPS